MQTDPSTVNEMFDPEFVQHLEGVKSFAETYTESTLQRNWSAQKLPVIIRKVDMILDQEIDRIKQALQFVVNQGAPIPTLDCQPGCSACCFRPVLATVPEVLAIGKYVDENFAEADRRDLKARIDDFEKETEACRNEDYSKCRAACPYLVNDMCSIYPVRPVVCRTRNSIDVSACIAIRQDPDAKVEVPSMPAMNAAGSAAWAGLRTGLYFEAADNSLVDLGIASKIMFENPNSGEQYLQGGKVFDAARFPMLPDPLDNPEVPPTNVPSYISDLAKTEPVGKLSEVDEDSLRFFYDLGARQAKYGEALGELEQDTPIHRLARLTLPRVYRSEEELQEWREHYAKALREIDVNKYHATLLFNSLHVDTPGLLSYQGLNDKDLMEQHGRLVCDIALKAVPGLTSPIDKKKRDGKLRVGYLSANMHRNTACYWSLGWIRNHGSEFETYAFNVGQIEDVASLEFRAAADHYFHLVRNVPETARFIRSLDLDVLIFTDIGGNGLNTVYSTLRMAPVQCTAWGSNETSGLSTIDYYISSELMEPSGAETHYTEKLVKLPGSGIVYPRFERAVPERTRTSFSIMENRKLLVCAQNVCKLLPREDAMFAAIAEKAKAPIVFIESSSAGETTIVKRRMAKAGVRAQWIPPLSSSDFLALLRIADVVVDTIAFNGGVTTIEAIAMGTPVVTCSGEFRRGRQSRAFLTRASAPGLIAADVDDYVALASDWDRQKEAATELDPDALFDDVSPVLELDKFLLGL